MTLIEETIVKSDGGFGGHPVTYKRTPERVGDNALDSALVEVLREWLMRNGRARGVAVARDEVLLGVVRSAFAIPR